MQPKIINILTSKKFNLFFVFVCSAFFACFGCISNSYGAEIVNDDVSLFTSVTSLNYSCSVNGTNFISNSGSCHLGANAAVPLIKFRPAVSDIGLVDTDTYYVEVYLRIANNANTPAPVWYGAGSGDRLTFVSEEQVSSTTSNNVTYRTYRLLFKFYGNTVNWNTQPASIYNAGDIFAAESYKIMGMIFWKVDGSGNDISSVVQAINNQTQYLQDISQNLYIADTHLDAIEDYVSLLQDIGDDIGDLRSGQEQANQDANDRYEDEKDTISDNGQSAQDSADSLDMSFGVPWILSAWYSLFIDSNCASIPTIKTWIHSTENQVCSPWPSAVRATLTPIFSVLSGLLLFGFVIRWLKGGMFNNSIEVG